MTLPNFLVIGAQKAGTTSLYYYLKQHPEVFMSPVKEAHFFDYEEGRNFRGAIPHTTGIEDYRALFRGGSEERAVGEASPSYIYVPGTAERIRDRIPDAKLIAILRNPADRAYSAFLHTLRSGREPLTDFAGALREEETRIHDNWHPLYHYAERGFYYVQLKRYFDLFGRDRIRVYLYEDLKSDPLGLLRDVFRFLQVDDAFVPDMSVRYNVTGVVPKNKAMHALARRLKPVLKRHLPLGARQLIKRRTFAEPPPLAPKVRRALLEGYREDILKLEGLIGRDLSGWLDEGGKNR